MRRVAVRQAPHEKRLIGIICNGRANESDGLWGDVRCLEAGFEQDGEYWPAAGAEADVDEVAPRVQGDDVDHVVPSEKLSLTLAFSIDRALRSESSQDAPRVVAMTRIARRRRNGLHRSRYPRSSCKDLESETP